MTVTVTQCKRRVLMLKYSIEYGFAHAWHIVTHDGYRDEL